jgi:hypothetical protein
MNPGEYHHRPPSTYRQIPAQSQVDRDRFDISKSPGINRKKGISMRGGTEMIRTKAMILALFTISTLAFLHPTLGQDEKPATQLKPNLPTIQKAVICEKVQNRTPWGIREAYPSTVGNLYCFTHLTEIPLEGTIYHVWYYGKKEMAKIGLSISPPQWRTWSSKLTLPDWKGDWKVEIVSGNHILKTLTFIIE